MDDTKWFIGFLLIFGIIWISGKFKNVEPPPESGAGTPQTQTTPSPAQSAGTPTGATGGASTPAPTPGTVPAPLVPGGAPATMSPLQGRVTIGSLSRDAVEREYVLIQASSQNVGDTDITGLTIRSGVSLSAYTIGRGWSMFFPSNAGDGDPILLRPGASAYVFSGRSPIGAVPTKGGFQLNLCSGFLQQGNTASLGLPMECPSPTDYPLPQPPNELSDACYNYLASVGRCAVPTNIPPNLVNDGGCQAFALTHINYSQCVANFKNAPGFFRGQWRIYLGRDTRLWRDKREIVELLDKEGRIIDSRSY